jgi:hypothetical protein
VIRELGCGEELTRQSYAQERLEMFRQEAKDLGVPI